MLWQPGIDPLSVAGLASHPDLPAALLSFQPSYNMAVNLSASSAASVPAALLEESFAQFQADRAVVGLAWQCDATRRRWRVTGRP